MALHNPRIRTEAWNVFEKLKRLLPAPPAHYFNREGDTLIRVSFTVLLLSMLAQFASAAPLSFKQLPRIISGGGNPTAIRLVDVNGDGKLDFVVADGRGVICLYGNGDGTASGGVRAASLQGNSIITMAAARMAAGDFDHDGRGDVAVTVYGGTVRVYLSRSGTLTAAGDYPLYSTPQTINAADFDGDDLLDLLVGTQSGAGAALLLGAPRGAFLPKQTIAVGSGQSVIDTADLNADGKLDFVASQDSLGSVAIGLGRGDGTFEKVTQKPVFESTGVHSAVVAAGKFSPAGVGIFVGVQNSFGSIQYGYFYRMDTQYPEGVAAYGGDRVRFAHADLDGDGIEEIAIANPGPVSSGSSQGGMVEIVAYDPNPAREVPTGVIRWFIDKGAPSDVTIGDVNGDKKLDVVAVDYYGAIYVFLNDSSVQQVPTRRRAARH